MDQAACGLGARLASIILPLRLDARFRGDHSFPGFEVSIDWVLGSFNCPEELFKIVLGTPSVDPEADFWLNGNAGVSR